MAAYEATRPKFELGDLVYHIKRGHIYVIVGTPKLNRIEATNAPSYAYQRWDVDPGNKVVDRTIWHRPQTEMEDGRFRLDESS